MAKANFGIIRAKVGEGGIKRGKYVKRIQQLLILAGESVGGARDDGFWGDKTRDALMRFKDRMWQHAPQVGELRASMSPGDLYLLMLAYCAGVLIRLGDADGAPRGMGAFRQVHQWLDTTDVDYGWRRKKNGKVVKVWSGGTKSINGFTGFPGFAIASTPRTHMFDLKHPLTLNCTSYANLMLSVWHQGHCHSTPYDPSQNTGGERRLAARYDFPLMGVYPKREVRDVANQRGRLYTIEPTKENRRAPGKNGTGTHLMLLLDGIIYQSNTPESSPVREDPDSIRTCTLEQLVAVTPKWRHYVLCGPSLW